VTKRTIIFFSSVSWNFLFQRHQSIAINLSRKSQIVYVNPPLRSLSQGLAVILNLLKLKNRLTLTSSSKHPNVDVIQRSSINLFGYFDHRLVKKYMKNNTLVAVIFYIPSKTTIRMLKKFPTVRFFYDRVLDWSEVDKSWFPPKNAVINERAIFSELSNVISLTDCEDFAKLLRDCYPEHRNLFVPSLPISNLIGVSGNDSGPVGYFGNLRESEVDIDSLIKISFYKKVEIVGLCEPKIRSKLERLNFSFIDVMPSENLVSRISNWSGIVLPYRKTGRTKTFVPDKLWSAAATRLPVYASGISVPTMLQDRIFISRNDSDLVKWCLLDYKDTMPVYLTKDEQLNLLWYMMKEE